jgi:hypothetical protein
MPFAPQDKPGLQGNEAWDFAENGDGCRQLLGRRLKPTLLKTKTHLPARRPSL